MIRRTEQSSPKYDLQNDSNNDQFKYIHVGKQLIQCMMKQSAGMANKLPAPSRSVGVGSDKLIKTDEARMTTAQHRHRI
jgi:hypothetical protein